MGRSDSEGFAQVASEAGIIAKLRGSTVDPDSARCNHEPASLEMKYCSPSMSATTLFRRCLTAAFFVFGK